MSKDRFLAQYGSDKHVSDLMNESSKYDYWIARNPVLSLENSRELFNRHSSNAKVSNLSSSDDHVTYNKSMSALGALGSETPHKEIQDKIVDHPELHISKTIAYNKNSSGDQIQRMYDKHKDGIYKSSFIPRSLVEHPNTPKNILHELSQKSDIKTKYMASQRLEKGDYKE